jgi:GTP-binding protein HflX
VGFLRDLPPALRQAFAATLEEVAQADLLLHVVDVSDPDREQQMATVEGILGELGAGRIPRIVVFNKCDRLTTPPPAGDPIDGPFCLSALDRRSTRDLVRGIEVILWERGRVDEGPPLAAPTPDATEAYDDPEDAPERHATDEDDAPQERDPDEPASPPAPSRVRTLG